MGKGSWVSNWIDSKLCLLEPMGRETCEVELGRLTYWEALDKPLDMTWLL